MVTGAFGAIAGAASVFGNTPLDVIKTRMQVGGAPRSPRVAVLPCVRRGSSPACVLSDRVWRPTSTRARWTVQWRSWSTRVPWRTLNELSPPSVRLDRRHLTSLSVRLAQVLQRHRSSAGTSVFGRGHRLHHLRGGGQGLKHRLEDGLNVRTQRCSRRTGWTWQDSGRSPITPASRFWYLPLRKCQTEREGRLYDWFECKNPGFKFCFLSWRSNFKKK